MALLERIEQLEKQYNKQRVDSGNILKYLAKQKKELISRGTFATELMEIVKAKMPIIEENAPAPALPFYRKAIGAVTSAASTAKTAAQKAVQTCTFGYCGRPATQTQRAPRAPSGPSNANLMREFPKLAIVSRKVDVATGATPAPTFPVFPRRSDEGLGAGAGAAAAGPPNGVSGVPWQRGRRPAAAAATAAGTNGASAPGPGRRGKSGTTARGGKSGAPKPAGGYRKTQRRRRN